MFEPRCAVRAVPHHRQHDYGEVAIRFPLTAEHEDLVEYSRDATENLGDNVRTGWTYLDVRDAARVVELALTRPIRDVQTIFVGGDETLVPYATEDLLDRYAPGVLRLTSFVGRQVRPT